MSFPQNWEKMNWHDIGVHVGKTDGWMNLEETLAEDMERHPTKDYQELVQQGIAGWEETDHFEILYGSKMAERAKEEEGEDGWLDAYLDAQSEFWEGYLKGRKAIGIDIYAKAKEMVDPPRKRSGRKRGAKRAGGSASRSVKGLK